MNLRDIFSRLFGRSVDGDGGDLPEGWTDDMRVEIPHGRTVDELVDHVIRNGLAGTPDEVTEQDLIAVFHLSPDDAALARDRAFGGIVRAATRNPQNCPDKEKDPIAWTSFQRATAAPSIVAGIYPQWAGEQ